MGTSISLTKNNQLKPRASKGADYGEKLEDKGKNPTLISLLSNWKTEVEELNHFTESILLETFTG